MARPLGVTGVTGRLGGRIATRLADAGAEQRLLARSPARAPALPGTQVVPASYDDREACVRALEGLDVAPMVSAAESVDRVQQHLEASGMAWTHLRDNLYADFLPLMAGGDGVLRGPAGDGRVSVVTQDDIAAAATAVLLDPVAHEGRTYGLTGPGAITLGEAAAVMTRALGRAFTFVDETLEEAYASRAGLGAPDWEVEAWVSTYTAIASGELSEVTDDVERLTGRPATSLAQLLS